MVWKIHSRLPVLRVVAADEALLVRLALRRAALEVRGADDDDVLGDDRRGVQSDLAGDRIDRLIVVRLQIDDAVLAEAGGGRTGLGVERDHLIAGRDVDDARALAAGARPVGEAAAREQTRRRFAALALVLAVHPLHLAGHRVERDDGAAGAGGGVDGAVDHQRRHLEIELGARAHRVGLEAPRDLELVEVVFVNLIERRVSCARQVAAVGRPFGASRLRLTAQARGRARRVTPSGRSARGTGVFPESCAASYRDLRRRQPATCTSATSPTRRWSGGETRARDGRVLLRIEDHDRQRCRPEYEAALLEDLAWLGFEADEPPVRQSERDDIYVHALDTLRRQGLVYVCTCSRAAEVRRCGGRGVRTSATDVRLRYPGMCRDRGLTDQAGRGLRVRLEPSVERFVDLRLGPQEQRPSEQCGDLLIRDREGNWTYQFAATVDDYVQGVTLVVRGEDLLDSTGRQIQLARLLGRDAAAAVPASRSHHEDGGAEAVEVRRRHGHQGTACPRLDGRARDRARPLTRGVNGGDGGNGNSHGATEQRRASRGSTQRTV